MLVIHMTTCYHEYMVTKRAAGVQPDNPSNTPRFADDAAVLVDVTPVTSAPFSVAHTAPEYRVGPSNPKPRWAKIDNPAPGAFCDECATRQHETRGASGPRMQPRQRRTITGRREASLRLCTRHATAWRERDTADQGGAAK